MATQTVSVRNWNLKTRGKPQSRFHQTLDRADKVQNARTGEASEENVILIEPAQTSDIASGGHELNSRLREGFEDMTYLEKGWNGYSAPAPSEITLSRSKELASFFPSELQPEIQPETDGTVGMYWETTVGVFCVKVSEKDTVFNVKMSGQIFRGTPVASIDSVGRALVKMVRRYKPIR